VRGGLAVKSQRNNLPQRDAFHLRKVSLSLSELTHEQLDELVIEERKTKAEIMRNIMEEGVAARSHRHYIRKHSKLLEEKGKLEAETKALTIAEQKRALTLKEVQTKKESIETQQLENFYNPHVLG
jgi:ABC-type phosphate transport system auxiliary subunit